MNGFAAINICAAPSTEVWSGAGIAPEQNVVSDDFGNVAADDFGNVPTSDH